MPKYNATKRFQLGDAWLSQKSGSPAWFRTWYDSKSRQTRRRSLGVTNFEEAKALLTDWFITEATKSRRSADDVILAEVFARFYEMHGSKLKSAYQVNLALRYWLEFYPEDTVHEAGDQTRQAEFRQWLQDEKKQSLSSVRNILTIGKSALNWAWRKNEIKEVPYFELVKVPKPDPKGRPLSIEEVAKLLEAAQEPHVKVLIVFLLGTAARTGAILDLRLSQIDLDNRIIDLNPPARSQTLKYRPTVKLPGQLLTYVETRKRHAEKTTVVQYKGQPVKSIKKAWRTLRTRSEIEGNVVTYSMRHTMARWMRQQSVPAWEVAAQLGHKAPGFTTTEIYAPHDPAYLDKAVAAIDAFLGQVACRLRVDDISQYLLNSEKTQ